MSTYIHTLTHMQSHALGSRNPDLPYILNIPGDLSARLGLKRALPFPFLREEILYFMTSPTIRGIPWLPNLK